MKPKIPIWNLKTWNKTASPIVWRHGDIRGRAPKRLNEQVRRNAVRFPSDFIFQLTREEASGLRPQFATSKKGRGGARYAPVAFTEQGVAMPSSVLASERAVHLNEAFAAIRRLRKM